MLIVFCVPSFDGSSSRCAFASADGPLSQPTIASSQYIDGMSSPGLQETIRKTLKAALPVQPGTYWVIGREWKEDIALLTDSSGAYLLMPGAEWDEQDQLLGIAVQFRRGGDLPHLVSD